MTKQEFHGFVDFPRKDFNTICGSTFLCIGWVICNDPMTKIQLDVDGNLVGKLTRDFPRPDVIKNYPTFSDQIDCGFYGQASAENFEKGKHKMSVVVETRDDALTIGPIDFDFNPELFLKK